MSLFLPIFTYLPTSTSGGLRTIDSLVLDLIEDAELLLTPDPEIWLEPVHEIDLSLVLPSQNLEIET